MQKMWKKKVIFIRSNPADRDVRVPKEIEVLKQAGYRTKLLYWDRECKNNKIRDVKEHEEVGLRVRAPWGIKILPFLPIWWVFVFVHLLITRWNVAHAVNFDCIIPTILAGKLKRKPVIYEILDVYEDVVVLPKVMRSICINVDKLFMRFANGIIVADEAQIEGVGGIPNPKVVPIYDSPPNVYGKEDISYQRNKVFTLFYAGALYKAKQLNLDKVLEAIKDMEETKLIIAGYGDLVDDIKEWTYHMPDKVQFLGKISYGEVIKRGNEADLFFVLRDPAYPTNRYTCGSTLFNAMICGKPILANNGSSTATKVYEENCGLVVDANNIKEIREAIIKLRDNLQLCEELGANARKAYEQKYSWEIMGQRLVALYQKLT